MTPLAKWLHKQAETLENLDTRGLPREMAEGDSPYPADILPCDADEQPSINMLAAEIAEEAQRRAAKAGAPIVYESNAFGISPRAALGVVGQLLKWADSQSPYFDSGGACNYLGITEQSLYGLVERKRLIPLRGPRRSYRFTRQQLDEYLAQNSNL
jgi:excisionase family DNA binding protein